MGRDMHSLPSLYFPHQVYISDHLGENVKKVKDNFYICSVQRVHECGVRIAAHTLSFLSTIFLGSKIPKPEADIYIGAHECFQA